MCRLTRAARTKRATARRAVEPSLMSPRRQAVNDWNVYIGGQLVAVVELTDAQACLFFDQLNDVGAQIRLAAWMNGTLTGR